VIVVNLNDQSAVASLRIVSEALIASNFKRGNMQKVILLILIICLAGIASAEQVSCTVPTVTVNNNVSVSNILTQIQWMTQQQTQSQQQTQQQSIAQASGTWIGATGSGTPGPTDFGGFAQESQTYSRLVYPGEVIIFPVEVNDTCTLLSGLPVGFYTVSAGHGYFEFMVQTSEATPTYDPVYHKMEFGHVPVVDQIGYWTMKAKLTATNGSAFCVVDNRAPMNGYTTIEVTVS
jgi:hypothetical protein